MQILLSVPRHSTFDMNDDSLMDRIFRTFDHDSDGYLTCNEWLTGLWIFLKGNLTEQTTYCFQVQTMTFLAKFGMLISKTIIFPIEVYDIDGDGYLNKGDLFQLLKSSLRTAIAKVQCRERRGEKIHKFSF